MVDVWRPVRAGLGLTLAVGCVVTGVGAPGIASASPPDGRVYELVTPGADKRGGGVGGALALLPAQVSGNGERVTYPAYSPFGEAEHGMAVLGNSLAYVADRTASGWKSTFVVDVPAPAPALQASSFFPLWLGSSPDLSRHFLEVDYRGTAGFTSGAWAANGGEPARLIAPQDDVSGSFPVVVGSAVDGTKAVVATPAPPPGSPIPPGGGWLLYQERAEGGLELVNADDAGDELNVSGAVLASRGATPGQGALGTPRNAVSADGSHVVFYSQTPTADPADPPRLFVRVDGASTVEISAQVSGPPSAPAPVSFVGASADGLRTYFASSAPLVDTAVGPGPFLYMYELPEGALTGRLSLAAGVDHPVSMTVPSPFGPVSDFANVAVSDDGSRVYYANDEDGGSIFSLDVRTGTTHRVATGVSDVSLSTTASGQYNPAPDLSPDGRFLAFLSTAVLTPGESNPGRKVYLYDAAEDRLRLLSPSGAYSPAAFDTYFYATGNEAELTPDRLPADANFVSDDGQFVFFGTDAALVAQDTNARPDVYRWHDGAVALVTPGDEPAGGFMIGAGSTGRDVFFYTRASLTPRDGDDTPDIYDARIGGEAFSDLSSGCAPPDCQGSAGAPPARAVAASSRLGAVRDATRGAGRTLVVHLARPRRTAISRFIRTGRLSVSIRAARRGAVRVSLERRAGRSWRSLVRRIVVASRRPRVVELRVRASVRASLGRRGGRLRLVAKPAVESGPVVARTFELTQGKERQR